ncbi:nucleoside deaminase [Pedococcus sp. NPDC057267]|uniref:nucleoside deaminase n=1 Tax=Pedococcus sp. NPDC057267 TaxID=3346077 RepID=UPI00362A4BE9
MNAPSTVEDDRRWLDVAVHEARSGLAEGGIPIGAAMVCDDVLVASGRNQRVQLGSAIRHGETDCIERAGRQPASLYRRSTLYTTLSPCFMCAGTVLLYGIPRVVVGENKSYEASEELLRAHGVDVVVVDDAACLEMMNSFVQAHPDLWFEDIGR